MSKRRQSHMPRPPDILRKGGGHRDRKRDAEGSFLDVWAEEEVEAYNLSRRLRQDRLKDEQ